MPTCEAIQIAHEMHVHGAPTELSAGDVDSHVTTCADCRAYVAESKRIDDMHVFAVPESEFSRLRSDVIDKRLPRLRREVLLGTVFLVATIVFGAVTGKWGAPIGGAAALALMWWRLDQRSRRLEAAVATNGRDLLAAMRDDLREEIAFTHKFDVLVIMAVVAGLVVAIYLPSPLAFAFLLLSVVAAIYHVAFLRARTRDLRALG